MIRWSEPQGIQYQIKRRTLRRRSKIDWQRRENERDIKREIERERARERERERERDKER